MCPPILRICFFAALVAPVSAFATEANVEEPIVVTANRIPTPLSQVASSVTIITAEEIRANRWHSLAEALAAQPGLRVAVSGSTGAQTSVFTRGTNSNHTLVLFDGVEISDPSTPNGAYDFAHLNLSDVARIEIVRGPQSGLYGSGAMGGVINIITQRGQGPGHYAASAESGSFHTYSEELSARGAGSLYHYALGLSHLSTDGQDITPARLRAGQNKENDGYRNTSVSFQGGVTPNTNTEINLFAKSLRARAQLDIGLGEDPDSESRVTQDFVRLETRSSLADGRWKPILGVSRSRQFRKTDNERQSTLGDEEQSRYLGESEKIDLQNQFTITNNHSVILGYERKRDSMTASGTAAFGSSFGDFVLTQNTDVSEKVESRYLQDQFTLAENFHGTLALRSDNYSSFPNADTYRLTPLYAIPGTSTKLKASYGTGYRAPSLYERFGLTPTNFGTAYRGNPLLKPEESTGWEIGIEQAFHAGRIEPYFTYFKNRISNLIKVQYLPSFDSTSVNIDNAITEGYETGIAFRPGAYTSFHFDYTRARTRDQFGQELLRRPRQQATAQGKVRVAPETDLSLQLSYTGRRRDVDRVSSAIIETGGYTVARLVATWQAQKNLQVHGKIDNLFNKRYEPIDGFQETGFGFFAGAEVSF